MWRGGIPQQETVRCGDHHLEKEEGKTPKGEELLHLGDVAQHPGRDSSFQTALNGGICLELVGLSYLWVAGIGYSYARFTKQGDSKWLKICLSDV